MGANHFTGCVRTKLTKMRVVLALAFFALVATASAQLQSWTTENCYIEGPYTCSHTGGEGVNAFGFELTMFRGNFGLRYEGTKCYVDGYYAITGSTLTFTEGRCHFGASDCAGVHDCSTTFNSVDTITTSNDFNKNSVCESWSATDALGSYSCTLKASDLDYDRSSGAAAVSVSVLMTAFAALFALFQ